MIAFPIPAPAGTPQIFNVLFGIAAVVVFVVLVWRVVQYFRQERDGDERERDDDDN